MPMPLAAAQKAVRKLLFALLVSDCAGCLASRLAGSLTLSAAAFLCGLLEISLVDRSDMLHDTIPSVLYNIDHYNT